MASQSEIIWTTKDSLELLAAVSREGVDAWTVVASSLSLKNVSPQDCATEFKRLAGLIHKRSMAQASMWLYLTSLPLVITYKVNGMSGDPGHLLEIAKLLTTQRLIDIRENLQKEALEFAHIVQNIQEIRQGKWDHKISEFQKKKKVEPAPSTGILDSGISGSSDKTTEDASGQTLFKDLELVVPGNKVVSQVRKEIGSVPPSQVAPSKSATFLSSLPSQVSAFATGVMQGILGKEKTFIKQEKEESLIALKKNEISKGEEPVTERRSTRRRKDGPEDVEMMDVFESEVVPLDTEDVDMSGTEDTPSGSRRRASRGDEKYKKWRQNSLMIWSKIADHRKGNTFLRKIKDEQYYKVIKEPMTLEMVKTRIREGIIKTTAEFHRDLSLVFANAIMFNDEDSEIYADALEIKAFADAELQNLLVNANE